MGRLGIFCAGALAFGCGSGEVSLSGMVEGHALSAKDAVFFQGESFEVVAVVVADQADLCGILRGRTRLTQEMNVLWLSLENRSRGAQPLVLGDYAVAIDPAKDGRRTEAVFFWTQQCNVLQCITPYMWGSSAGKVSIVTLGDASTGRHFVLSVDLSFAADRVSGRVDASACNS